MSNNTIIEDGYDVDCDSCGMNFGWVGVASELPKKLLLCKRCSAKGCTDARLEAPAEHGDKAAIEELNRRSCEDYDWFEA